MAVEDVDTRVHLVPWPDQAEHLEELRARGEPRLLLVDEQALPPDVTDCLEDWVRVPAFERDIRAREAALLARAQVHLRAAAPPWIDDQGILRFRGRWVGLAPVDRQLAQAFLDCYGELATREVLVARTWPHADPAAFRNNLDVQIMRLRRRLAEVGLEIRTVRSGGYVLQAAVVAGPQV